MKKLILVHGDKGGSGKTHTAHLTAAILRQVGHPVTLVDGDAKNPGVHRYFDNKPDPVLRINARKPEGIDALIDAFLEAPADVLVDLPAGGSDMTNGFLGAGSAAGTVDIEALFQETGDRLVIMFVIDQSRDALVAVDAELKRLPDTVTDWVIVRNHRMDAPFERFERWNKTADLKGATIIDMPPLDRRAIDALVDAKAHIGEIDAAETASALSKIRAKAALRVWRAELVKAGVING
ncbi:division plane positioning ATPase MipZ [Roseovarius nanhaiticus]|uniref:division plane positioning ATPase MipZ n=1 Tax=Roseovarius nanhaiticus TaxID=573024 RepID=UPI0024929251|nr:division plane positioning ATPase MipZ [Roseovarius nanhaiticus]